MSWTQTNLEDEVGGFILWGIFLLICASCAICSAAEKQKPESKTDWPRIYEYVKRNPNNEVTLFLKDLSTPNGESVSVYIKDDKNEYKVGAVAFYVFNKSNFILDLTPALRDMKAAPSDKAKIVFKADKGVEVKCDKIIISPTFLTNEP